MSCACSGNTASANRVAQAHLRHFGEITDCNRQNSCGLSNSRVSAISSSFHSHVSSLNCLGILIEVVEVQLLECRAHNGLLPHTYGGSDSYKILGDLI
jgi:hypothetical protein